MAVFPARGNHCVGSSSCVCEREGGEVQELERCLYCVEVSFTPCLPQCKLAGPSPFLPRSFKWARVYLVPILP